MNNLSDAQLGQLRNVVAAAGGLAMAYGLVNQSVASDIGGAVVALVVAIMAFRAHALTLDALLGVVRAGGSAAATGIAFWHFGNADLVPAYTAVATQAVILFWSWSVHSPASPPASCRSVVAIVACGLLIVAGCAKNPDGSYSLSVSAAQTDVAALEAKAKAALPIACDAVAGASVVWTGLVNDPKKPLANNDAANGSYIIGQLNAGCLNPPTSALNFIAYLVSQYPTFAGLIKDSTGKTVPAIPAVAVSLAQQAQKAGA